MYGLPDALERFKVMMDLFRWREWPGLFPVPCRTVTEEAGALVLEDEEFRITGAPVQHRRGRSLAGPLPAAWR